MTEFVPLAAVAGSNSAIVTFAIYVIGVMVLAALSNRLLQSKSFLSEYFLGSRSLGVWAFALTFAATSSSGGSFIGFPSLVYTHGWVVALWIGSYMIVPIVSMGLLGKRINQVGRRTGAITIPDVMRDRFESPAFGILSTGLIIFFMAFNLIAQFKSGSLILNTLLSDVPLFNDAKAPVAEFVSNLPILSVAAKDPGYLMCLGVFAVAVIVYTTYGGFRAVVWTDVMQGFVMVVGVIIMLPLTLHAVGGLKSATEEMAEMTPPRYVYLRVAANESLESAEGVPKNAWLSIPQSGSTEAGLTQPRPRLFRTLERAEIPVDQRSAQIERDGVTLEIVPAIEITYPVHIDRVLKNEEVTQSGEEFGEEERALKISVLRQATLKVHAKPGETSSGNWFDVGTALQAKGEDRPSIRFQSVESFTIDKSGESIEVSAVETPETGMQLLSGLEGAVIEIKPGTLRDFDPYKFGDGRKGVYVTGPGPSRSSGDGFLPLALAVSFFFMWTFSGAGQPSNMVRLMAFKEASTLRRAIFTVSIYYSLIYFPLVIIFCCARVLLPGWETESDRIMPEMAKLVTAAINMPWLAGLLVAAPFAAVMSTMDSFLLMISSAVVRDVYQRNINPAASPKTIKRLTYVATLAVGLAAMLAAVNPPQFLQDIIVFTGSGLSTSFLAPVALSLYWPRFNKQGAICGMVGGFATHITLYTLGYLEYGKMESFKPFGFHPFIVGAIASLVIAIVAALATPAPPTHIVRKFFYREDAK